MTQYALSCASWQAEREGWDRSAEALIAQRAAAAAITKEEIIDRNIYRLEDDNKRLREKVSYCPHAPFIYSIFVCAALGNPTTGVSSRVSALQLTPALADSSGIPRLERVVEQAQTTIHIRRLA